MKEDLTGVCNDVKVSIINKGSLSMSILVSYSIEPEVNTERYAKSKFSLIYYSPTSLAVLLKLSLSMLVTSGFSFQRHSFSGSGSLSASLPKFESFSD